MKARPNDTGDLACPLQNCCISRPNDENTGSRHPKVLAWRLGVYHTTTLNDLQGTERARIVGQEALQAALCGKDRGKQKAHHHLMGSPPVAPPVHDKYLGAHQHCKSKGGQAGNSSHDTPTDIDAEDAERWQIDGSSQKKGQGYREKEKGRKSVIRSAAPDQTNGSAHRSNRRQPP
jgi:hypothetical protein